MNSPQFRAKVERNDYPSYKEKRKKSEELSKNTNVVPSPRKRRKIETMPYLLSRTLFQEGPSLGMGCGVKKDKSSSASVDMKDDQVNFFGGIVPLEIKEHFFRFELCFNCLTRKEGLLICSSCEKALYCDTKCQRSNWLFHQKFCLEFEIQMPTRDILLNHFDNAIKKATPKSDGEVVILPSRSFYQEKKNVQKVELQMAYNEELGNKRKQREKRKNQAPLKAAKQKERQVKEIKRGVKKSKIISIEGKKEKEGEALKEKREKKKDIDKKELQTEVKNNKSSKNNIKITSFNITFPKTFAYSKKTLGFLEAAKRLERTINK